MHSRAQSIKNLPPLQPDLTSTRRCIFSLRHACHRKGGLSNDLLPVDPHMSGVETVSRYTVHSLGLYVPMLPSILLTNIRSVTNKIEELSVVLTSNNISICCITESWLTEKISTSLIDVTGYTCYRKDRNGRAGGGVMCYVRCDIACQRRR